MIRATLAIVVCLAVVGASSAQALELQQVGPEFAQPTYVTSPLGKILRVDPNPAGPTSAITIPPDNPFAGGAGEYEPIVWSYGLRNPYRFSFDRLSGGIAIGDVGQGGAEEIDFAPAPRGASSSTRSSPTRTTPIPTSAARAVR